MAVRFSPSPAKCLDCGTIVGILVGPGQETSMTFPVLCEEGPGLCVPDPAALYPPDELEAMATIVLWHFGAEGGIPPGDFYRKLVTCWQHADQRNQKRLAIGFPCLAACFDLALNHGRLNLLRTYVTHLNV